MAKPEKAAIYKPAKLPFNPARFSHWRQAPPSTSFLRKAGERG